MPRSWHDRFDAAQSPDKDLYLSIVADKKPYFMKYIYPSLLNQYNKYIKNTERNALREFGVTVSELKEMPTESRTERQEEFIRYYDMYMPVGVSECVMNKICHKIENQFDSYISKHNIDSKFDYSILKSDVPYSKGTMHRSIKRLYEQYNKQLQSYKVFSHYERIDEFDAAVAFSIIKDDFMRKCTEICSNSTILCDILVDTCYKTASTKNFVWSMCGDEIIENLLRKNNNEISFPVCDKNGTFEYAGEKFSMVTTDMEVDYGCFK